MKLVKVARVVTWVIFSIAALFGLMMFIMGAAGGGAETAEAVAESDEMLGMGLALLLVSGAVLIIMLLLASMTESLIKLAEKA